MADLYSCTITEETLRRAWRDWTGDPNAEPPLDRVAEVPSSFVAAAMEDAALSMLRILLVAGLDASDDSTEDL